MAVEIERKFLVNGTAWRQADPLAIRQGYLNRDPERTVRVRVVGDAAWLTIKGITTGASRTEFEYAIPAADGKKMLGLCDGPLIEKARHLVTFQDTLWEVDEFLSENAGLVVAEVELEHEAQAFARPPWLGKEVSDDPRYFNSKLASRPFRSWKGTPST